MKTLTENQVKTILEVSRKMNNGKFFTVQFYKKDHSIRTLTGRCGVKKYVKGTGSKKPAYIKTVYEIHKCQYRSIDLTRLISFTQKNTVQI